MHPCITGSGAIFDMQDPCHTSLMSGGVRASTVSDRAKSAHAGHCPIGTLDASA
jgi:hypothetical protein